MSKLKLNLEDHEPVPAPAYKLVPYSEFNLLTRLTEIKAELEARKALYEEYDYICVELAKHEFHRAEIGGMVFNFKDNFADKNTAFTAAGVKRFDVEVITKALDDKRKAKK